MRMVFAHDHVFDADANGHFYSEKLPYNVWAPYLERFDDILIFGRSRSVSDSAKPIACGPGVMVRAVRSLSSPWASVRRRPEVRTELLASIRTADCVVVRLPSEIGLLAFWTAHELGKPTLVEMVGDPRQALWHHGTISGKVYSVLASRRNRKALRHATHVIYVTKQFLQRNYPTFGRSVGISDVRLEPASESVVGKRIETQFGGGVIRIGMIGELLHYKGIATLIDACARLRREGFPIVLQIVGSGDPRPWRAYASHAGIGDTCDFMGTLLRSAVFEWLDSLDVYVQPSLTEGLPRATLEAMGRACPVIASNVGGLPEIVQKANLCTPGMADEFASAIKEVLLDKDWRRSCCLENFSIAREYARDVLRADQIRFLDLFINDHSLIPRSSVVGVPASRTAGGV